MKTLSAQELENIGVPFDQDVILDMWHNDDASISVVFKLDYNYYSVRVNFYLEGFHWYDFYEDENNIPLEEVEARTVTYTRYFPVADKSIET